MSPSGRAFILGGALLYACAAAGAGGQTLSLRTWRVGDGLAHDGVSAIHQDRDGYIWFATWEGLSRYDGVRFVNYDATSGLVNPMLFDVAEDHQGRIWVACWGAGVARLDDGKGDSGAPVFRAFIPAGNREARDVSRIVFDAGGRPWCLTSAGLFRAESADGTPDFRPLFPGRRFEAIHADPEGRIWLAEAGDLLECVQDTLVLHPRDDRAMRHPMIDITDAGPGRIVVADSSSVWEYGTTTRPLLRAGQWRAVLRRSEHAIRCVTVESSGRIWVGTWRGLVRCDERGQKTFTTRDGLPDDFIRSLEIDREGNLWISTRSSGVARYSGDGVLSWTHLEDGRSVPVVCTRRSIDGRRFAVTATDGVHEIRDGGLAPVPGSDAPPFHNLNYRLQVDHRGVWWAGTDRGLYRVEGSPPRFESARRIGAAEGLPELFVLGVWVDPTTHELWVGPTDRNLYVADLDAGEPLRFRRHELAAVPGMVSAARLMRRDRRGILWITGFDGIVRLDGNDLRLLHDGNGLPDTQARCVLEDRSGRLWMGLRNRGLVFTDEPAALSPRFTNLTMLDGLSSNVVWWIEEGTGGDLWLGTGRGLNRLDPHTGRVVHLTTRDGLAGETVNHVERDADGLLWLATSGGVSRYDPSADDSPGEVPPVYIARVEAGGEVVPLHGRALRTVGPFRFPLARRSVAVDFVAPAFRAAENLRFSWILEGGSGMREERTEQRTVQFARLGAGSYRFRVRALDAAGRAGPEATVAFDIVPPVWRRPWFLLLAAGAFLAVTAWVVRLRFRQAIELERIRGQIALDLHDDVGSGLAEIAVLNEVARRGADPEAGALLAASSERARLLREAMNDIVWSVDPRRDRVADLVQRMREAAHGLLGAAGTRVEFDVADPDRLERMALLPDVRRQLFLLFKEAMTNIARHAGADVVRVRLACETRRLRLEIADDGCGFDPATGRAGNGLRNMAARARRLGGRLDVSAAPGAGTRLVLEIPLRC